MYGGCGPYGTRSVGETNNDGGELRVCATASAHCDTPRFTLEAVTTRRKRKWRSHRVGGA